MIEKMKEEMHIPKFVNYHRKVDLVDYKIVYTGTGEHVGTFIEGSNE